LNHVLGKLPQKVFHTNRKTIEIFPFNYPYADLTAYNYTTSVFNCLDRVLRLTTVGSKRFLTSKVDRSVTGLIAQQQCVGPLHIPLANFGAVSLSYFSCKGAVTAIGEQPIKGLISPAAMGRLCVGEMLTNIV
jgi:phosphoribosylformylglycinamidine synthase